MQTAVQPKINLIGQKFFRWTVLRYTGKGYYLCKCECGTEKNVYGSNLRKGTSQSCGCYGREVAGNASRTHGMTKSRTYGIWAHMQQRCFSKKCKDYANWGGRGITVCERWLSFESFLADMGAAPSGMTIDRIDNNGNYEPGNCRWASMKEQARNRSNNAIIDWRGERKCLAEWAETVGIHQGAISRRLASGWSLDDAMTIPLGSGSAKKMIAFRGRKQSLLAWSKELGLKNGVLFTRLKRGWSLERALSC